MTLPFLKVLMALAVASATPLPEAGLLFRKPMGMVWAKGGGLEEMKMELVWTPKCPQLRPHGTVWCPRPRQECGGGGHGATHVSMKRLCHKPAALYAVPGQQLVRGHQPTSVLSLFFSSLKDPHRLRSLQLPLQSPREGG